MSLFEFMSQNPFLTAFILFMIYACIGEIAEAISKRNKGE